MVVQIQEPLPGFAEAMGSTAACPYCSGLGELEATDIFCGAGGSSLGLEFVCCPLCGRSLIKVTQALNHWDLAVQAHNQNFPHADHDVHDVEVIAATRFRRTALLWASPECTHHAYCRGPKATTEDAIRSRATFADIVRFTAHHKYDGVIVENVVEARLWCDEPGHSDKCSCGGTFNAWFRQMLEVGYEGRIIYFNSQFALPTPQSRDRMYVVFWRKGGKIPALDFCPPSWCERCQTVVDGVQTWKKASSGSTRTLDGLHEWGRYGQQYLYTCPRCAEPVAPAVVGAKTAIDWTIPAPLIGDREKPLAAKTHERIRVGMQRVLSTVPDAVPAGGGIYRRAGGAAVWSLTPSDGAVVQVSGNLGRMRADGAISRPVENSHAHSTAVPVKAVHGSIDRGVVFRYGGQSAAPTTIDEPMGTITAHDRERGLMTPSTSLPAPELNEDGEKPWPFAQPRGGSSMVVPGKSGTVATAADEPVATVTTRHHHMLVQVNRGGQERRARAMGEPTQVIAGHGELALVSMRNHGDVHTAEEPAQAVCGGGYHHGLLVYNGMPGFVRSLEDAGGTVTARDKQSLLVPYYRTGVARATGEPFGTVTARDREALVITDEDIDACGFRMLQWPELLRAQMMHRLPDGTDYVLSARRRNKRGQVRELSNELRVKMIGNAVSSPVATMLGWAIVDSLR